MGQELGHLGLGHAVGAGEGQVVLEGAVGDVLADECAPGQELRRSRHKWLEAERAAAGVAVPQKPSWVSKSGYSGRD